MKRLPKKQPAIRRQQPDIAPITAPAIAPAPRAESCDDPPGVVLTVDSILLLSIFDLNLGSVEALAIALLIDVAADGLLIAANTAAEDVPEVLLKKNVKIESIVTVVDASVGAEVTVELNRSTAGSTSNVSAVLLLKKIEEAETLPTTAVFAAVMSFTSDAKALTTAVVNEDTIMPGPVKD
jgi:hypothetical protein